MRVQISENKAQVEIILLVLSWNRRLSPAPPPCAGWLQEDLLTCAWGTSACPYHVKTKWKTPKWRERHCMVSPQTQVYSSYAYDASMYLPSRPCVYPISMYIPSWGTHKCSCWWPNHSPVLLTRAGPLCEYVRTRRAVPALSGCHGRYLLLSMQKQVTEGLIVSSFPAWSWSAASQEVRHVQGWKGFGAHVSGQEKACLSNRRCCSTVCPWIWLQVMPMTSALFLPSHRTARILVIDRKLGSFSWRREGSREASLQPYSI